MAKENAAQRGRKGFTLIELLVVLGIIIILMGLLFPVISGMRKQARKADTTALMSRLQVAINNYYGDFRAYPGPFAESQVDPPAAPLTSPTLPSITDPFSSAQKTLAATAGNPAVTKVTSTENLFLALEGGLTLAVNNATTPQTITAFTYDSTKVGQGPQSLNVLSPKTHLAYYNYQDAETTITNSTDPLSGKCANPGNSFLNGIVSTDMMTTDSVIPEFIDKFTPAMPILYMRARAGTTGIVNTTASVAAATPPQPRQYDDRQVINVYGGWIVSPTDYQIPTPNPPTGSPSGTPNYTMDDVYFANPGVPGYPRGKDGYLLISAGQDGIFGTADDIFVSN